MGAVTPQFGELPPSQRGRSTVIVPIIEALKARPGEWALVYETPTTNSAAPVVARLKKHGADATQRKSDNGAAVWARWPQDAA